MVGLVRLTARWYVYRGSGADSHSGLSCQANGYSGNVPEQAGAFTCMREAFAKAHRSIFLSCSRIVMGASHMREAVVLNDETQVRQRLKVLFNSQPLAVLGTQSQGQPYVNLVAFAASADLKELVFATNRSTKKYANLVSNPSVAMLVDNRSNRVSDFREAMAVTATGPARELEGKERDRLLALYLSKHSHLREFVTGRDCALMGISVNTYVIVSRFQDVTVLHVAQ